MHWVETPSAFFFVFVILNLISMNMELLTSLFANLALVAVLFMLAKWFIKYDLAWYLRHQRGNTSFKNMRDFVYLEIRLPKDVFKTPAAMETVLLSVNQGLGHAPWTTIIHKVKWRGFVEIDKESKKWKMHIQPFQFLDKGEKPVSFYKWVQDIKFVWFVRYLNGSIRAWSSLEILSEEGNIKFILVTKRNNVELFKQSCYAQFPGVEITETEDPLNKYNYTNQKNGDTNIYVGRYSTSPKEDHLPIKTYVDYGLEKEMVKDEFKIDPLVVLLESMAQAGKGEMYWVQIIIRPTIYDGSDKTQHYNWLQNTKDKINEILGYEEKEVEIDDGHGGKKKKKVTTSKGLISLTLTEKHQVEIMQRNLEKPAFDCVMKMFYWVDKKVHPKGIDATKVAKGVMTVVNAVKPFEKPGYSKLAFDTITTDGDTPYLDPDGSWTERKRWDAWKKSKLRAAFYQEAPGVEFSWKFFPMMWKRYRVANNWDAAAGLWSEIKEYWFHPGEYPHRFVDSDGRDPMLGFVLNLEELVTLWHFPGKAFGNTESKVSAVKADPPSNLPI